MSVLKSMDISEAWYIAKDPDNIGQKEGWEREVGKDAVSAFVPSIIQQFFPGYHGVAYYWCKFTPSVAFSPAERAVLRFGGADYLAEVWLNSHYLGLYEGGETPFSFDVTDTLKSDGENLLAVRIVNPCERDIDGMNLSNVPHRNKVLGWRAGSNFNQGGLWYGVTLSALPAVYIEDDFLVGDIHTGRISLTVTTRSAVQKSLPAVLDVSVYERNTQNAKKTEKSFSFVLPTGDSVHSFAITLPEYKLWSVDAPNLYTVTLTLKTETGAHTLSVPFGFREFTVKDGFFYLNGERILLKSSHSGNNFPIGQLLPVHKDQMRRDFIYAKACGFNMLRAIAGLFRPEQLELADEIGLLIYEECYASWCLGHSHLYDWQSEEEITALLKEKQPNQPIGDEKTMLARWVHSTEAMILRDRNHPSVVIWGLLNETKNNSVFRTARDFLPRAREIDPSRVIVLSSARWDYDLTLGSASNPYSAVWENTWGPDGNPALWDENAPSRTIGDNHYYPLVPIAPDGMETLRTMGSKTPLPFFLSESGVGSNFHVIEEWKQFLTYGYDEKFEDAAWLKKQSEDFTRDFYAFGLDALFPFPDEALKESQRINADERKRFFDIVRSNPRIAGYSLTGLLDHGMCGEGLWSYWRRFKPGMFDAVSEGWADLRFCLFVTPVVYAGDSVTVEAVLANNHVLADGRYTADFAIVGDEGVVTRFSEAFDLCREDFATPICKRTLTVDAPAGKYRFMASLREAVAEADTTELFVLERPAPIKTDKPIYAVGLPGRTVPCAKPYRDERGGVILVGSTDADSVRKLLDAAHAGAVVAFLDASVFDEAKSAEALLSIDGGLAVEKHMDWLYHKDYALLSREVFEGIEGRLAGLTLFGPVFANTSFRTGKTPERVLAPGFLTGYYGVEGAYAATHALIGYRYGAGEVYLNSFQLLNNTGHPIADRILHNLVAMLSK